MCGRFQFVTQEEQLIQAYPKVRITQPTLFSDEIFPTQPVSVIMNTMNMVQLPWGLKVSFTKRPIINARLETIDTKDLFKEAFEINRCLIPMSGFFEWDQNKKKYLFKPKPYELASFAGIVVTSKIDQEFHLQTTILTKAASSHMQGIHQRMPILIPPQETDKYFGLSGAALKNYLQTNDLPLEMRLV